MAEAEKSLDIVIRTKADLEGARAVEDALGRDIVAARELERAGSEGGPRGAGMEGEARGSAASALGSGHMLKHELHTGEDAGSAEGQGQSEAGGIMGEFQSDAGEIQAAGERLAAALERNGRATIEMLQRTIEAAEEQNRRLAEVERRVAELSQRIKGSYLK